MSTIQKLKNEGALLSYHDGRSGCCLDFGSTKDGTPNSLSFSRLGWNFDGVAGGIDLGADFIGAGDISVVFKINARSKGQNGYGKFLDNGKFIVQTPDLSAVNVSSNGGGTVTANCAIDYGTPVVIGITRTSAGVVNIFKDAIETVSDSASGTPAAGTTNVIVGNRSDGTRTYDGLIAWIVIVNRILTDTEISDVQDEMEGMRWPQKATAKAKQSDPNEIADGDMEAAGVASWLACGSGDLTKDTTIKYSGTRSLKITGTGANNPGAYQSFLEVGKTYRVTGKARGNGTVPPRVYSGATLWVGTTDASFQSFDETFVATNASVQFYYNGTTINSVWFDNVNVVEVGKIYPESWKTDWGAHVSASTRTGGFLENTPFTIDSGLWRISTDSINGADVKAIENVSIGNFSMPISVFGQTPTEALHGRFEFWMKMPTPFGAQVYFQLSEEVIDDISTGTNYNVTYSNGSIALRKEMNYLVTGGVFTMDAWHKHTWTISAAGVMKVYVDDIEQLSATDTSYTSIKYISFRVLTVGTKISYSDVSGNHSIYKAVL